MAQLQLRLGHWATQVPIAFCTSSANYDAAMRRARRSKLSKGTQWHMPNGTRRKLPAAFCSFSLFSAVFFRSFLGIPQFGERSFSHFLQFFSLFFSFVVFRFLLCEPLSAYH